MCSFKWLRCLCMKKVLLTFVFTVHSKIHLTFFLFKVNNRSSRKWCEICSNLTIKTIERRELRRPYVFVVNFENISRFFPSVSIVDFEQINAGSASINLNMCIQVISYRNRIQWNISGMFQMNLVIMLITIIIVIDFIIYQ